MLTSTIINQVFDEVWETFSLTDDPFGNIYPLLLERLGECVSHRTDQGNLSVEECHTILADHLLSRNIQLYNNGMNLILPDDAFSIIVNPSGAVMLNAIHHRWSSDVTRWSPEDVVSVILRVGSFRQWCGDRENLREARIREKERIREIMERYHGGAAWIEQKYSEAVFEQVEPEELSSMEQEYMELTKRTHEEIGDYDERLSDEALARLRKKAEKYVKDCRRREKAALRATESYYRKKAEREQRLAAVLHKLETLTETPPVVTHHKPMHGRHFDAYTYTLLNGQAISLKDYTKEAKFIPEAVTTLIPALNRIISCHPVRFRFTYYWMPTPDELEYWKHEALRSISLDNPLYPVIASFGEDVSFQATQRTFHVLCFISGGPYQQVLTFSIPKVLDASQAVALSDALREFHAVDRALHKLGVDYVFTRRPGADGR